MTPEYPMYWRPTPDGRAEPCDREESCRLFETDAVRRVALTEVNCGGATYRVSTVFLVIDHGFHRHSEPNAAPVLWETMVSGPEGFLDYQDRYTSRADAEAGHARAVGLLEKGGPAALS
jgi:hypothetical protein